MMRSLFVIALLALATAASAQPAKPAPSPADAAKAKALNESGLKHFELAEYDEAIADYKEGYRLSDAPAFLFNIAQSYRLKGDCKQALTFYKTFARRAPDKNEDAVKQRIAEMEECVAKGPAVPVQAEPAKPAPPPASAEQPAATPAITGTQRKPTTLKWLGYGTAGVGVVGLGVGIAFGLQGKAAKDDLADLCAVSCTSADALALEDKGKKANRNAIIASAVGGAALIGGGVLIFLSMRGDGEAPPLAIAPTQGGATASWAFHW